MTLLILITLISTTTSFMCSLMESVLLSTTNAYIALAVKDGRHFGKLLQELKDNVNRPLSAILTINTIANTLGGAAVGALVQRQYGDTYLALASAALTILILIFGELLPKVIGASHWKSLAPAVAHLIRFFILAVYPFVYLSQRMSQAFIKDTDSSVSREEVIVTAEIGADEGSIRPKESAVIKNLLMLDNMKVSEVMTPRSVMYAFDSGTRVGDIMTKHKPVRFSRIPVYKGNLDHVLGVVHRYKILEAVSHDQDQLLVDELMTPVHAIPENISVAAALDQFIKRHEHIFVVVNDYGSVTGIVSLEDAIETLLGVEIVDEFDSVADLRQLAKEQWRLRKGRNQPVKS